MKIITRIKTMFWSWISKKSEKFLYEKKLKEFFGDQKVNRNFYVTFLEDDMKGNTRQRSTPVTSYKTAKMWYTRLSTPDKRGGFIRRDLCIRQLPQ